MLAAGTKQSNALNECRLRLQKHADAGHGGAQSALLWVEGLASWLNGNSLAAAESLVRCVEHSATLGGSHAQRTIIKLTAEKSKTATF